MAPHIPEPLFMTYELMFAIITPALICGAFADRMRFPPMLLFMSLWHLTVYCPMAHATCTEPSLPTPGPHTHIAKLCRVARV
jgi:ammonia channel protein AmtB